MAIARAHLESLLRARRLDRTLTTALPPPGPHDEFAVAPTGVTSLDASLAGGFPRGQVSELVGPRSSGRASLLLQTMAAATARGELVALMDVLDMFDVESAAAAGVDLDRVLWIRGHAVVNPGLCRDLNQRALEQAMRAFALVLQAGNFGLVVFDAAEIPADALRRLPFTTWLRLQRMVEGSQTACLLVGNQAMARSAAGLTVHVGLRAEGSGLSSGWRAEGSGGRAEGSGGRAQGSGIRFGARLFEGLDLEARIVSARRGTRGWALDEAPVRGSVLNTREHDRASASGAVGTAPQRHPVLDPREDDVASVSGAAGEAPQRRPVLDTREDDGARASGCER